MARVKRPYEMRKQLDFKRTMRSALQELHNTINEIKEHVDEEFLDDLLLDLLQLRKENFTLTYTQRSYERIKSDTEVAKRIEA